jgi:hypothetical protein
MKKKKVAAVETPPKPVVSWVEDEPVPFAGDENAKVIKLAVGESTDGEIVDIVESKKWPGRKIYKLKEFDSDKINVLLGTVVLDRLMSSKAVGDKLKILRLPDQPSDKGNPTQVYKTFTLKES